jgi:acyl-CoA reductase-like NAD-dependent aldehyde dehydrogenase
MGIAVSPQIHPQVAEFLETPRKMLINGKWVSSISGKTFATYNPATGEILAQVAEGDRQDIEEAVKASTMVSHSQSQRPPMCHWQ